MIEIFDKPLCCPTGLCGPTIDQSLLDINELLLHLQATGISVERYQMNAQPTLFATNAEVMRLLQTQQMAALPITTIDGRVIKSGAYPVWEELAPHLERNPA
jgi:hypothetical protein